MRVDTLYDKLLQAGRKATSIELLPPNTITRSNATQPSTISYYLEACSAQPAFVSLTYHQERTIIKENAQGTHTLEHDKYRFGSDMLAAHLAGRFPAVPFAPHFICGGFSRSNTRRAASQLELVGINNVIALRGDENTFFEGPNGVRRREWVPHPRGYTSSLELIEALRSQLGDDFGIGVGCYPEGHPRGGTIESDLTALKNKQDAGASFALTQMVFRHSAYTSYVDRARARGITIPIIPGTKPVLSPASARNIARTFGSTFPRALLDSFERTDSAEHAYIGFAHAREFIETLWENGNPIVHQYVLNRADNIRFVQELSHGRS